MSDVCVIWYSDECELSFFYLPSVGHGSQIVRSVWNVIRDVRWIRCLVENLGLQPSAWGMKKQIWNPFSWMLEFEWWTLRDSELATDCKKSAIIQKEDENGVFDSADQ